MASRIFRRWQSLRVDQREQHSSDRRSTRGGPPGERVTQDVTQLLRGPTRAAQQSHRAELGSSETRAYATTACGSDVAAVDQRGPEGGARRRGVMNRKVRFRGWMLAAAVAIFVSVGVGRALIVDGCLPFVTPQISVADVNARAEVLVTTALCMAP
jgi:hypothetical protein